METWQPPQEDDSPDLTPMIDVVFLLIVFFMTVAVIITSDKVEVDLPIAEEAIVPEEVNDRATFTIDETGKLYAGPVLIDEVQFAEIVSERVADTPDFKVYLRADANTPHRFVRDVMNLSAENGAFNIVFGTFQTDN